MAASFKLPSLVKKRKPPVNLPRFEWRDISIKEDLGSGTFGSVYLANYEKEEQNVIIKKMKGESAEGKRRLVRVLQVRVLQVRVLLVRVLQVRVLQVRVLQVRVLLVRVLQVRVLLVRVLQVRVLLVRVLQVRVLQVRVLQVQSSPVQSSPRNTVCQGEWFRHSGESGQELLKGTISISDFTHLLRSVIYKCWKSEDLADYLGKPNYSLATISSERGYRFLCQMSSRYPDLADFER